MTSSQAKLFSKLPEIFVLKEDYRKSQCPPTIILDEGEREIYRFRTGDAKTFFSLIRHGNIEFGGNMSDGNLIRGLYKKNNK